MMIGRFGDRHQPVDEAHRLRKIAKRELLPDGVAVERSIDRCSACVVTAPGDLLRATSVASSSCLPSMVQRVRDAP